MLPELRERGVPLYGILHEEDGAEEFNNYLKGQVLFDKEKTFYGPQQTRAPLLGLLRWSVIKSMWSAQSAGVEGNMKGDGTLLGSSLVVGPEDQGILYQYRSRIFGDRTNPADILKAVKQIKNTTH